MQYQTKSIASRIEWCRQLSTEARTPLEREGWQAEEEGAPRRAFQSRSHKPVSAESALCVWEVCVGSPGWGRFDSRCRDGTTFRNP